MMLYAHLLCLIAIFAVSQCALNRNATIVIVGSGIAGLGAADRLINIHGFKKVYILEALDRLGGRIESVPYGNGTLPKGSEWLRDVTSPLYRVAKKIGALASPDVQWAEMTKNWEVYIQNGCRLQPSQIKQLEKIRSTLDEDVRKTIASINNKGVSVGQVYLEAFEKLANNNSADYPLPLLNVMLQIKKSTVEAENSVSDWNKLSVRSINETFYRAYIGLGPFGFKPIVDYFIDTIPKSNVIFNTQISRMYYNRPDSKVQMYLTNGGGLVADHVIMTSSLGVLQRCARAIFNPPLPNEKFSAMESLGFDSVDKIFLIYDQPFWKNRWVKMNFVRVPNEDQFCPNLKSSYQPESVWEKAFWSFDTKPYHNNVLVTSVIGNNVRNIASLNDRQLGEIVTNVIRKFFKDNSVPPPQQIVRSNWQNDPTFQGSFSYDSVDCDMKNCRRSSVADPVYTIRDNRPFPSILFAGEATHDSMFSTTEGALFTGIREADRIQNFIDNDIVK